ncbi:hypothetical protein COOONC_10651 [Cooperia oncophora]
MDRRRSSCATLSLLLTTFDLKSDSQRHSDPESHGVLVATMWYYRFSLSFSFVISATSAVHMIYFFHRFYGHSMIFFSLCLCCLTFNFLNIFMKAHHLALSYFYAAPCSIFLPRILYIVLNLPIFSVLIGSQFMQFSIVVERWFATIFIGNYESGYRKLGPALIAATVLATACVLFAIYYNESFNEAHLNARWLTAIKDAARTNVALFSLVIVNFLGLVLTTTLRYLNPKRRIRWVCGTVGPYLILSRFPIL